MRYRDRTGRYLSPRQYSELLEKPDYRTVRRSFLGPYAVVTIWIGIETSLDPPELFETTAFRLADFGIRLTADEADTRRWKALRSHPDETEAGALLTHEAAVQRLQKRMS